MTKILEYILQIHMWVCEARSPVVVILQNDPPSHFYYQIVVSGISYLLEAGVYTRTGDSHSEYLGAFMTFYGLYMKTIKLRLESEGKTKKFGVGLGKLAGQGDVICLDGELGSGKTTLTQAIALGMDVDKNCYVTSPSFNIFHEYLGKVPLYHMDFYRLTNSDDVVEMGLDEYFYGAGITVIEWAGKALDILPQDRLSIFLTGSGQNARIAVCTYPEALWQERITVLLKAVSRSQ